MEVTKVEYRVRPVTRYIVTSYTEEDGGRGCSGSGHGEFDNEETAYQVGYALAKAASDMLGCGPGDMRVIFPKRPSDECAQECI